MLKHESPKDVLVIQYAQMSLQAKRQFILAAIDRLGFAGPASAALAAALAKLGPAPAQ